MADQQQEKQIGFDVNASDGEGERVFIDVESALDHVRSILTDPTEMLDGTSAYFVITRNDRTPGEVEALQAQPPIKKVSGHRFRQGHVIQELERACMELMTVVEGGAEISDSTRADVLANARDAMGYVAQLSGELQRQEQTIAFTRIEDGLPELDIEWESEDEIAYKSSAEMLVAYIDPYYAEMHRLAKLPPTRTLAALSDDGKWYQGDEVLVEVKGVLAWAPVPRFYPQAAPTE